MSKPGTLFISIILTAASVAGCSNNPKQTTESPASIQHQVTFYKREAQEYRELGNQGMADYFEQKAYKASGFNDDKDYDFFDFILDVLFDN